MYIFCQALMGTMAVYLLLILPLFGALAEVQITVTSIVNLGSDELSVACQFSTNDSAITDVNSIQMYSNASALLGSEESKIVSIVYDRSSSAGLIAWQHSGLQTRANVSGNVDSPQSSLLHLHITASNVLCEDGAAYRCEFSVTRSGSPLTEHQDAMVTVREGPTDISYSRSSSKPELFSNATLSIYPANTTVNLMCNATVGSQPEPMQLCYYDTSVNGTGYVPFNTSSITDSGVMATETCNNRRVLSFEYHLETNDSATFLCVVGGNDTCGEGTLQQFYTILSDRDNLLPTIEPSTTMFTTTGPAVENNTMLTTAEHGMENNTLSTTAEHGMENNTLFTTAEHGMENNTIFTTAEHGIENDTLFTTFEPDLANHTVMTSDAVMENVTSFTTTKPGWENQTVLTTATSGLGNHTLLTTIGVENYTLQTTTEAGIENHTLFTPSTEPVFESNTSVTTQETNDASSTSRDPASESFTSGTISRATEHSSMLVTFTDSSFSAETTFDVTHTFSTSHASASATASTVESGDVGPTTESVLSSSTVSTSVATASTINNTAAAPSDAVPTSTASPVSSSFPSSNVTDSSSPTLSTAGASDSPGTTLPASTGAPLTSTQGAMPTPTSSAREQIHTTGIYFVAYVLANVFVLKN